MNIIEVARDRDKIMAAQDVYCPVCSERQFGSFDKLYTKFKEKCVSCTLDNDEALEAGELIFQIIEG